jgi:hypothetical protein
VKKLESNNIRIVERRRAQGIKIRRRQYKCPYGFSYKYFGMKKQVVYSIDSFHCKKCEHYVGRISSDENFIFCNGDDVMKDDIPKSKYLLTEKRLIGKLEYEKN